MTFLYLPITTAAPSACANASYWARALVKAMLSVAVLMAMSIMASAATPLVKPDAQGWNGSGWYLTSGPVYGARSEDWLAYVLFGGPYPLQSGCLEVYDRLYSPIGTCRFLDVKPPPFAGRP